MAKTYDNHKESGIAWIGTIPNDWKIVRQKNIFDLSKNLVGDNWSATQLLSLTTKGIKCVDIGTTSGKVPDSYNTYQVVNPNCLVMCLFDLDCSAVFSGLSNCEGMISPAYKVLSVKETADPRYYSYWFDYIFDGRKYMFLSKNIRYSLTYDEFASLPIAYPSLDEQKAISSFLDKKCMEIDSLISLQEEMISDLQAYKQSVITEAVTKGLEPNVKFMDSGVDWIGVMPDNWQITKIKRIADTTSGSTPRTVTNSIDATIKWFRTTDINENVVSDSPIHLTVSEFTSASCPILKPNTCLVAMYGGAGTIGKFGMLAEEATINQALCSIDPHDGMYCKYIFYILKGIRSYWMKFASGTRKDPNINQEIVRNMLIPVPPVSQQHIISDYLDDKTSQIDSLIALKQEKIQELKEYKKSIIYEYVTGKKRV